MDTLPITVIEEILLYLDVIDRHNAIEALQIVETDLCSRLISRMNLAFNLRFSKRFFRVLVTHKKHLVKHLDLTGIFWIAPYNLKHLIFQLENIEILYLLGTKIFYRGLSGLHEYLQLKKLQYMSIVKHAPSCHAVIQVIKKNRDDFEVIAEFQSREYTSLPSTCGLPINGCEWLSVLNKCRSEEQFKSIVDTYKKSCKKIAYTRPQSEEVNTITAINVNTKVLYIQKDPMTITQNRFSFDALSMHPNITHLYIDAEYPLNLTFLKLVFTNCRCLESLSVTLDFPTVSTSYFKDAPPTLQYLSIFGGSSLYFNLPKFFYDIKKATQIQLRRLLLSISKSDCNKHAVDVFLANNPQLDFLIIACDWTQQQHRTMQSLFNTHIRRSSQYFYCWRRHTLRAELKNIPLMYLDMARHIMCVEYILTA